MRGSGTCPRRSEQPGRISISSADATSPPRRPLMRFPTLPPSPASSAEETRSAQVAGAVPVSRTILLVEHDDNLRRLLAIALTLHGFASCEARNGVEALAILDRHEFDAVILDVVLPDIDGASIREEIAAHPATSVFPSSSSPTVRRHSIT